MMNTDSERTDDYNVWQMHVWDTWHEAHVSWWKRHALALLCAFEFAILTVQCILLRAEPTIFKVLMVGVAAALSVAVGYLWLIPFWQRFWLKVRER